VISGGLRNVIYGDTSDFGTGVIGGGYSCVINSNSWNSVICGGDDNSIASSSSFSTVGGGTANTAGGQYSTIPGGQNNTTTAANCFAAGYNALANEPGEFTWADNSTYVFNPYAQPGNEGIENSFNVRATGGFYVNTGVDSSGISTFAMQINPVEYGAGVSFFTSSSGSDQSVSWSPGEGSWAFSSDRNLKDRFAPVEATSVLDKVAQLPVVEWSYKGYPQRHIGTMAQDFHALFPLNDKDTVLNDSDLHGVELAAIKGLNQKLETKLDEKDAQIQSLKAQNDSLAQRLNELEAAMEKLALSQVKR
jgi:hypothetical protein